MLIITVLGEEHWDNETKKFSYPNKFQLELEHSLSSLSKWESKWEIPFLGKSPKTREHVLDYVNFMNLTPNPPADWLEQLSNENLADITTYFDSKQSAAWFSEANPEPASGETITADLVYYWMSITGTDWEAQYWHLNRLLTLIKIHTVKNSKPKPMGRSEMLARRRALNKKRLAGEE